MVVSEFYTIGKWVGDSILIFFLKWLSEINEHLVFDTTPKNVTQLPQKRKKNSRFKNIQTVYISKRLVGHILHEILALRKLPVPRLPRLLTPHNECSIWHYLNTIPLYFCVVSWPYTKHISLGEHDQGKAHDFSRHCGLLVLVLQKRIFRLFQQNENSL